MKKNEKMKKTTKKQQQQGLKARQGNNKPFHFKTNK